MAVDQTKPFRCLLGSFRLTAKEATPVQNETAVNPVVHHDGGVSKTLGNTDVNGARQNVKDIVVFGDGDMFKLLSKASSEGEGWMKSTKAMEIPGAGCVVQVTTQQRNPDGSYAVAEAACFVPDVRVDVIQAFAGQPIAHRALVAVQHVTEEPQRRLPPDDSVFRFDQARADRTSALHIVGSVHHGTGASAEDLTSEASKLLAFIQGATLTSFS